MNTKTPKHAIIFDTEYWTSEGAPTRSWNGLYDHPPLLIQIAAFRIALADGLPVTDEFFSYVRPKDAWGKDVPINEFFTQLTKITPDTLAREGRSLKIVIEEFKEFVGSNNVYSYGYDLIRTIVPSCFINGVSCPFPPKKFHDIRQLFKKAGVTDREINENSSGTIAAYLGGDAGDQYPHDARNDAYSLVVASRMLLRKGSLDPSWF